MARICYVSVVHPLHDHRFLYKQCAGLADAGHDVSFIVDAPEPCVINGVHVIPFRKPANRLYRMLRMPLIFWKMLRQRVDVYHLCDVELLPSGIAIKLLTNRQVVYDMHEDTPAFALMKPYLPRPVAVLVNYLIRAMEYLAGRLFDGFVYADPGTTELCRSIPPSRRHIFYNVPLMRLFQPNPIPWADRKYDLVFLGSMSVTSGTLVLLDAISALCRSGWQIKVLFLGLPSIPHFEQHLRDRDLTDIIEVTGRVNHDQVPQMLNQCKIGLVGLLDLPKFYRNIATKIFEYWAKGIPVVSSDLPPERKFFGSGKHGLLVQPNSPEAFATAIASILSDSDRGERMAAEARNFMEENEYSAEKQIEQLVRFYTWLLANPR